MATIPRFQINGVLDTSNSVLSNLNMIANSAGCWISFDATTGLWSVVINEPGESIRSFNDSNIIGNINISGTGISELFNAVSVTFPNKDLRDQTDVIEYEIDPTQRFPNELDNVLSIDLPLINDPVQAAFVGQVELKQSRVDKVIEFRTDYTSLGLKGGDLIDITSDIYGYTNKVFRVLKVIESDSDDGSIVLSITALEYDEDVYDETGLERIERNKKTGIVPKSMNTAISEDEYRAAIKKFKLVPMVYAFTPAANDQLDWINKDLYGEAAWEGLFIVTEKTRAMQIAGLPSDFGGAWDTSYYLDNPIFWHWLGREFTAPLTGWYKLRYFINWGSETLQFIEPTTLTTIDICMAPTEEFPWIASPAIVQKASVIGIEVNNVMYIPGDSTSIVNVNPKLATTGDARTQIFEDHQVELFFYCEEGDVIGFWFIGNTDWGYSHPENNLYRRAVAGIVGELYYIDAVSVDID